MLGGHLLCFCAAGSVRNKAPPSKNITTRRNKVQPQEHRVPDRPPPLRPPCPHRWLQGLQDPQLLTSCPEGRALTGEVHLG